MKRKKRKPNSLYANASLTIRLPYGAKALIREFSETKKRTLTKTVLEAIDRYHPLRAFHNKKLDDMARLCCQLPPEVVKESTALFPFMLEGE
jgi:hypothetical protein